MISLDINGKNYQVDVGAEVPLLWVIREHLQLTGTKFGCGIGACGSCTVHLDGKAVRSCQTTVGSAAGRKITTIEGLAANHPVINAWIKEQVPQCGYCQSGQIMQAAALLAEGPNPSDDKIVVPWKGTFAGAGPTRGSNWQSRPPQRRANGHERDQERIYAPGVPEDLPRRSRPDHRRRHDTLGPQAPVRSRAGTDAVVPAERLFTHRSR